MDKLGVFLVPCVIGVVLLFGLIKRVPVFDVFVSGAKEGLHSALSILPSLLGLMLAVSMLSASGALDVLATLLAPAARLLGLPPELLPLAFIKPISGSGSTAVLTKIFESAGPDSFAGRVGSVMSAASDTTFYCVAVYFGAVGVKKTRHTVPAALAADLAACLAAAAFVRMFLGG